jgi:hypothetical protein
MVQRSVSAPIGMDLFNQLDPRQLFFRVDIFRRRKILRMVQTAGGNVDLIRPTVGLVAE